MRALPPQLLRAAETALLLDLLPNVAAPLVVLSANVLGDSLAERLAAQRAAR